MVRLWLLFFFPALVASFLIQPKLSQAKSALFFFDKLFEEEGTLGKGITVGKIQVALMTKDRSRDSIFGLLEEKSRAYGDSSSSSDLARFAYDVCMALLRRSDEWAAASSESVWFSQKDASKAESQFNDWANKEAAKFEKVCAFLYDELCDAGVMGRNMDSHSQLACLPKLWPPLGVHSKSRQ